MLLLPQGSDEAMTGGGGWLGRCMISGSDSLGLLLFLPPPWLSLPPLSLLLLKPDLLLPFDEFLVSLPLSLLLLVDKFFFSNLDGSFLLSSLGAAFLSAPALALLSSLALFLLS